MKDWKAEAWRDQKTNFISHMVQMKDVSGSATPDEIFIFISHMVQMKDRKA